MEKRPYIANTTKELETVFKQNQNSITVLKKLRKELSHRNRKAALLLLAKVEQRIEKLNTDINVPHEPEQMNLLELSSVKKEKEEQKKFSSVPDSQPIDIPMDTDAQIILNNTEIKTETPEKKSIFKYFLGLVLLLLFVFIIYYFSVLAYGRGNNVYVNGYTKQNGTYVEPYYRTKPDKSQRK